MKELSEMKHFVIVYVRHFFLLTFVFEGNSTLRVFENPTGFRVFEKLELVVEKIVRSFFGVLYLHRKYKMDE